MSYFLSIYATQSKQTTSAISPKDVSSYYYHIPISEVFRNTQRETEVT